MFNPEVPYNDLPLLPPKSLFDDRDIQKLLIKASRALSKLNGLDQLENHKITTMMISPFLVSESVQSNHIENIHTTVEAFYKEKISAKELTWTNKEVQKYREAIMTWYQKILKSQVFIANDIVEIQSHIEPNKPWIQSSPDKKIQNSQTGEVIYTPPQGQDLLTKLMTNLEKYINDDTLHDVDPLIKAIIIHHQIEAIHPFLDGNGRTGRIVVVLYLVLKGLLTQPMLFISGYINKTKDLYYTHLKEASSNNNLKPLICYMLEAIEVQSELTIEKILKIKRLIDHTKYVMHDLRLKESDALIDSFIDSPYFTITWVESKVSLSRPTLTKYFQKLEKSWIIKRVSGAQGSYIYYELAGLVEVISSV